LNAVSSVLLLLLLMVVMLGSRRWALLSMMASVLFLTQGHSLNLGGLSFFPIRFIETAALVRVVLRRELTLQQLNRIDWVLLIAYNYTSLVWTVRSEERSAEQLAFALEPTICYLALRGLTARLEDLRWVLVGVAVLLVPFTALVALERVTGQSSFALVGANWPLYFREGVARASGPFRHASLLGSIGAAFFALYVGLWVSERDRPFAVLGGGLCMALVVLSNSGGPLTSAMVAVGGWLLWPLRQKMRVIRVSMFAIVVLLAVFMKAPIWYLPYKASLLVGGGGYHRGVLMESAWNDLGSWWLFGTELRNTLSWIPYAHGETGGADITNGFLVFGIKAGALALLLLVLVLCLGFRELGVQLRRAGSSGDVAAERLLWGLGIALGVHAVSWLGIAYFDQSWVIWLWHLSLVSVPAIDAPVPVAQSTSHRFHASATVPRRGIRPSRLARQVATASRAALTK
jgi:hypothetical protein